MEPEHFDCGCVKVSRLEMEHHPRETFDRVHFYYGEDAARRLYEQWWDAVEKVGADYFENWVAGYDIRSVLGITPPARTPAADQTQTPASAESPAATPT